MKTITSHYEPISNIDEDYLNSCSPVELLQGIHNSYPHTYDNRNLFFTQKYFHMAIFCQAFLKYGLSATNAFKIVEQVRKISKK